jgi:hypothetical protein
LFLRFLRNIREIEGFEDLLKTEEGLIEIEDGDEIEIGLAAIDEKRRGMGDLTRHLVHFRVLTEVGASFNAIAEIEFEVRDSAKLHIRYG